ncbi:DNA repair protein endonuclease SAE2/CtIP C-terminus-domain-containing protein [Aspergillus coremiiformis]|uniref:DNA repair protein endonuclease SAE2/CtIP C-terminus-domain-containing protein n=1 Tax=Aspergillus coremiiformis TaxID=138285 RepID=A0A5N6YSP2_9EURO|nr:DNA repair protein endonuclease SAE2/CtIP C-terminus-domain-containing protein [Aspergillus coremiiformis]
MLSEYSVSLARLSCFLIFSLQRNISVVLCEPLSLLMDILKCLHASVAQNFEDLFDNAYSDLNAVLTLRDTKFAAVKERLRITENARNEALAEIEKLKVEITHLREDLSQNDTNFEDAEASVSESQLEQTYAPKCALSLCDENNPLGWKYDTKEVKILSEKYVALYRDAQTLVRAHKGLKGQIKRHKRKLEHWRKCLDRDEFTLVLNNVTVTFQRVEKISDETHDQLPTAEAMCATVMSDPVNHTPVAGATDISSLPSWEMDRVCTPANCEENTRLKNCFGQSLQAWSLETSSTKFDPFFENEESGTSMTQRRWTLKRKRGILPESWTSACHSGLNKRESNQPIAVKSENMSSSPLRNFPMNSETIETQDWDEASSIVETPTKEMPINTYGKSETSPPATIHSPSAGASVAQSQQLPDNYTALQPVHGIVRAMQGVGQWPEKKSAIVLRRADNFSLSSVTEDGEQMYPAAHARRTPPNVEASSFPAALNTEDDSSRLQNLLEGPPPPRQLLQLQRCTGSTRDSKKHKQHKYDPNQHSLTGHNTHFLNDSGTISDSSQVRERLTRQQESTDARTSEGVNYNSTETRPQSKPYRDRPLYQLELGHFRINPEHNQGIEYAFGTVVRNRDERKCIKGCVRSECCGERFLAMARLGGLRIDPTVPCQEEDQKVLEEYLGEDKYLLGELKGKDRQDILDKAKAGLIADRFGKHKNNHQRPATPPGFWRTDMPNTQELELDHEEARRLEKDKVKERYREAMRTGGLWKYADE